MQQIKVDARKLSKASLNEIRQFAVTVRRHSQDISQRGIAIACGVSQPSISRWLRRFGDEAPARSQRGIKKRIVCKVSGNGLSMAQEAALREIITKDAKQIQLPGFRLTRKDLIESVRSMFGVSITPHAAAGYLEQWGVDQGYEDEIVRFLEDHSDEWFRVSEIADGVGCSMQRANKALMDLYEAGACRAEVTEEYDAKYRLRIKTRYRANQEEAPCELARLFGMVAVKPVGGRVVRGRAMRD